MKISAVQLRQSAANVTSMVVAGQNKSRAAVFDFDGTIADTFPIVLRLLTEHRAAKGLSGPSDEEIHALRSVDSRNVFEQLNIPRWKVPFAIAMMRRKLRKVEHEIQPFHGIREILEDIVARGWQLYILSSNNTSTISAFFKRHHLPQPLEVAGGVNFFGKELRLRKLLAKHALDSGQVVLIGDETRDLYVGAGCGCRTIGVTWGFNLREVLANAKPDALASNPAELINALEGLLPATAHLRENG